MPAFEIAYRRLDGPAPLGADGLVRALARVTGLLDEDTARVLSGVAFRTYFLTPDDNHAYRTAIADREWAWGSLDIENYGIVESLAVHFDRDLRIYPLPRPADAIALARHEFEAGRPIVGRLAGAVPEHVVVTGLRGPNGEWAAPDCDGLGDEEVETIADLSAFAENRRLVEMVTVRPSPTPIPAKRRSMLQEDVLSFAGRHARSRKELHYGHELFYASGLRAWEVAADLLSERWREDDAAEFERFWCAWVRALRDGRAAVARVLAHWASERPELEDAAKAYAAIPDAIPDVSPGFDWGDSMARGHVAGALRDAADLDAFAVESLEEALRT